MLICAHNLCIRYLHLEAELLPFLLLKLEPSSKLSQSTFGDSLK